MKKKKIINLIDGIILFLGTWLLPIFVGDAFGFGERKQSLIAALICILLVVIFELINIINRLNSRNEETSKEIKGQYDELCLFAINGRGWAQILSDSEFYAKKCTVMIREFIPIAGEEKRQRYSEEVRETIALFKKMKSEQKIGNLEIYEYDYISDVYYLLLDKEKLYWGLNQFSDNDSTGQWGNRDYRVVLSKNDSKMVEEFYQKFINCKERYKERHLVGDCE